MIEAIRALQKAVIEIAEIMRVGGLWEDFGVKGEQNQSGDRQDTVDVAADEAVVRHLTECDSVRGYASEERESITMKHSGRYLVVFDPLDGSQNIGVNITTGLIFGIFDCPAGLPESGRSLVAAGYAIFGAATQFVCATREEGVAVHTLNPKSGLFEKTKSRHRIPAKGKVYACNEGLHAKWVSERSKRWAEGMRGRSVRWMACMVADAHRVLMNGGGFLLPADSSNSRGKLRLLYEAYPMAFVFECAGGTASTEDLTPILDLPFPPPRPSKALHVKVPVFLAGPFEAQAYSKL